MMSNSPASRHSGRSGWITYAWFGLLIGTAATGCGDSATRELTARAASQDDAFGLDTVPLIPHPDIFTHRTTRVARGSQEIGFTIIQGMAVDVSGNIYVDTWLKTAIPVIDSDAGLVRVIGREGEGPGEFRSIGSVDILSDGKLLVYDGRLARITVFSPGGDTVANVIPIAESPHSPSLGALYALGTGEPVLLGRYALAYRPGTRVEKRVETVRALTMTGAVLDDSVLAFPIAENFVRRSGGGLSVTSKPFSWGGQVQTAGGRLYYGWTDTVGVRTYSPRGEFLGGFKVAYERAGVTSEDLDHALSELDARWERAALRDNTPETWPAFETFVVDDRGRAWFGIVDDGGVTARWDGFTVEGEYVGSIEFPPNFDLMAVRGRRAYGVRTNQLDVPRIEIYRIDWVDRGRSS